MLFSCVSVVCIAAHSNTFLQIKNRGASDNSKRSRHMPYISADESSKHFGSHKWERLETSEPVKHYVSSVDKRTINDDHVSPDLSF